jgi:hypothetical protein
MNTPSQPRSRVSQGAQRTFTWAVRSTDIPFMATDGEAGADGCNCNCNDCGCGNIRFDPVPERRTPQDKRP